LKPWKLKQLLEKIMRTAAIKPVTAADERAAIDVVVRAFSADPAARWLYPDSNQYSVNFPNFVKAFGGKAFEHGGAYTIDDYAGAALWLPPDVHPDDEALAGLIQRSVPEHRLEEVFAVFQQMDATIQMNLIGICRSLVLTRPNRAEATAQP
jgi:hypothetical protein